MVPKTISSEILEQELADLVRLVEAEGRDPHPNVKLPQLRTE